MRSVTGTVIEVRPNNQPQFPSSETGARSVDENTAAGRNIGTAIAAEDDDDDPLTYSISGADADFFDVVTTSGQLQTKKALDRESRATYSFTMSVHDDKDSNGHADPTVDHRITVTVTILDVNEAPDVMGPEAVTKAENSGTSVGAYTADDPEIKAVTWETLRGADAGHFAFDDGALSFVSEPDFEARRDNTYEVTVRARDEGGKIGERPVTVTVTNVDEPPTIDGLANVDYAEGGTGNVATYRAVDPEGATIIWTLAGAQGGKFTITNGVLRFRETPDYEERSRYALIVEASVTGRTPTTWPRTPRSSTLQDLGNHCRRGRGRGAKGDGLLGSAEHRRRENSAAHLSAPTPPTGCGDQGRGLGRRSGERHARPGSRSIDGALSFVRRTHRLRGRRRDKYVRSDGPSTPTATRAGKDRSEAVSKFATQPDRSTNTCDVVPAQPSMDWRTVDYAEGGTGY